MNWLPIVTLFAGFILGLVVAFVIRLMHVKSAGEGETERKAAMDAIIENIKASFGSLSLDALKKSTEESLKLSKEILGREREVNVKELNEKKGLIDLQLKNMTTKLEDASKLMKALEKDRENKFGELTEQLKKAGEQTKYLTETTVTLREALSSTKARGQWGERMAEDVLRLVGLIENVNYEKQKAVDEGRTRPDFTFFLPNHRKLNMDVKFPLDNYMKFLEADSVSDKANFRNNFLKDVKARAKEITTREYINPEKNTVDCALLFIPNEQVYAFINEQDRSIIDEGLNKKIIFCSPMTLYAILVVIRRAVENFAMEKTSNEILSLLGEIKKQWSAFVGKMEMMGKRIAEAQKEYDSLATTRKRQLDRSFNKIEELSKQRGLPIESTVKDVEALSLVEEEIKEEDI
ncbi:MAG: DNA recombination protein RmuC [Candidatus Omnitrophica bacterium]|nr:DNA recombination protein RmuC [Candidatus Omnitrophota bacterium]MBU1047206.1 DNA recombination protein RmuC [Candidatus Omnitrophota bacterium]MBU1630741.1 DNA recombination protein RmuC [Candidatus Omnitrophota bacterium]MBU1889506.1 DNA recombination protein RmuC [Candidatus Omnitrophota bacterium]